MEAPATSPSAKSPRIHGATTAKPKSSATRRPARSSRLPMAAFAQRRASLLALCFGNFIIGTGTLIVPGMLPQLAEGLGVSLAYAGLLVTAFAATVCVGAPLLAGVTSRFDRRALLAAMQLLFFAGHAAAALVSSFAPMVLVRMLTSV